MRELARAANLAPSTLSRQIAQIENARDDWVFDHAIKALSEHFINLQNEPYQNIEELIMSMQNIVEKRYSQSQVEREARRILRRLSEKNTVLLVSEEMEMAGVFREATNAPLQRLAVISKAMVQEFLLRDWIKAQAHKKILRYHITEMGRKALKRMTAQDRGLSEEGAQFRAQHAEYAESEIYEEGKTQRYRVNLAESPLLMLARKKSPNGNPFINARHVSAGERLREDFEVAQIGARVTQNWDRFLANSAPQGWHSGGGASPASERAHQRFLAAMEELGTGLSEIAFRCCCALEGIETAERRLGWSPRSGKIVLRIALDRLADFYEIPKQKGETLQR